MHGDNVAEGHWRNPQVTEQTFGARLVAPSTSTPEGLWLRTGDPGATGGGVAAISAQHDRAEKLVPIIEFDAPDPAPEMRSRPSRAVASALSEAHGLGRPTSCWSPPARSCAPPAAMSAARLVPSVVAETSSPGWSPRVTATRTSSAPAPRPSTSPCLASPAADTGSTAARQTDRTWGRRPTSG
jgi:hypothetical protein